VGGRETLLPDPLAQRRLQPLRVQDEFVHIHVHAGPVLHAGGIVQGAAGLTILCVSCG
jgi:hypothetical protein